MTENFPGVGDGMGPTDATPPEREPASPVSPDSAEPATRQPDDAPREGLAEPGVQSPESAIEGSAQDVSQHESAVQGAGQQEGAGAAGWRPVYPAYVPLGQPPSGPTPVQPSPWSQAGVYQQQYGQQPGGGQQQPGGPRSAGGQAGLGQAGHVGVGQGFGQQPGAAPQGGFGGYGPPTGPPTGPATAGYAIGGLPPEQPRGQRPTGLIVGIAALALVIGGAAGGLGGYLVSNSNKAEVVSSLSQSVPASHPTSGPSGSVQDVANKVLPEVVTIAAEFENQGNLSGDTGSGIVISSNGEILTNNHVIADAVTNGRIQVIFANGKTVSATVVGRDPTSDIAVIKADNVTGLPVAQLGRSGSLSVGQNVVAIGAPFELSGTVTSGIISSLHRPTAAGDGGNSQTTVLDAIQTDAAINPGNSGGPLVDMQGDVIGINSAIYSPGGGGVQGQQAQGGNVGIGFAIPIDQAKRIATEIVSTGKAIQTVLGVSVSDNTPTQNGQQSILPSGALIGKVTPGGPADKAGLKTGSVVVKADGRVVNSSDGLVAAVHAAAPGDKMTLTLSDGRSVTATLAGQTVNPN
jgi:putative serine protease PepD